MTSQSLKPGRRNTVLGTVIGTVLASYAGGAGALEFETDGGTRIIWNTTLSVGSSWRDQEPDPELFTRADGSLIGIGATPLPLFTRPNPGDGLAGNQADSGTLNYDKGDRFSTPLKLLTDVEIRKGDFGLLVRGKAWYDDALENGDVRLGNQPNNYNGVRPGLGPQPGGTFTDVFRSPWPEASLSDDGFEDEQQFSNALLLDAYLYGGFDVGETKLQLRLGRQVINWGESVFIQGVNQINPIDVPAARRPGAELKEVLLPVAMAYANWGFSFGSMELFYQFEWDNTSIDSCGTYWAVTENNISSNPGKCNSATVITNVLGSQPRNPATGQLLPVLVPQLGSNVFAQANGLFVPLIQGVEPRDSGQFGAAFRFPDRGHRDRPVRDEHPFAAAVHLGSRGHVADPDHAAGAAAGRAEPLADDTLCRRGDRPGRPAFLAHPRHRRESARRGGRHDAAQPGAAALRHRRGSSVATSSRAARTGSTRTTSRSTVSARR